MEKVKILAVVGSLRAASYIRQLAVAAQEKVNHTAEFELLDFADVQLFNKDIEFNAPENV